MSNPFATQPSSASVEPSWLMQPASEPTTSTASALPPATRQPLPPPPPPPQYASPQYTAPAQHTSQPVGATPQQEAPGQVPLLVTYMRIGNLAMCALMCATAVTTVAMPTTVTPASWVLAFYVLAFSCLLCCFEFNLKQVATLIADNFGFLYDAKSRAVFLVFAGVLCFSLGILGKITGACMVVVAIFNTYVLWKYPEFQRFRPPPAEEAAATYIRGNPELSRKAGAALMGAASSR